MLCSLPPLPLSIFKDDKTLQFKQMLIDKLFLRVFISEWKTWKMLTHPTLNTLPHNLLVVSYSLLLFSGFNCFIE